MGRNSGAKVHWTVAHDGTNYYLDWYCQPHSKYDHRVSTSLTVFDTWETEISTNHGNVEQ